MAAVLSDPRSRERTMERAETLNGIGLLAWPQSDYAAARRYFEESLAIREEVGDRKGVAGSLNNLGNLAAEQGDFETARSLFEGALLINREIGNRDWEGHNLNNLGNVALDQGEYETARAYLEQSLTVKRDVGDMSGVAFALLNLGACNTKQGEPAKAAGYLAEALELWRTLDYKEGEYKTLGELGNLARLNHDFESARSLLTECLSGFQKAGSRMGAAHALEGFAHLAHTEGHAARAVRHFGAADALREKIGTPQNVGDREEAVGALAHLRTTLGEEAFTREWEAGRATEWDEAAAYALQSAEDGFAL
jgi:tetratricopeptide (TPR) repeat protein